MTMEFASSFNTIMLMDPHDNQSYMDSGATDHLANSLGIFKSVLNIDNGKSVTVANGSTIPIQKLGSFSFHTNTHPPSLTYVLVTASIIKNFIDVRKLTRENAFSIEFDPFGFSVKDLQIRKMIFRSDSTGDLYLFFLLLIKLQTTLCFSLCYFYYVTSSSSSFEQ